MASFHPQSSVCSRNLLRHHLHGDPTSTPSRGNPHVRQHNKRTLSAALQSENRLHSHRFWPQFQCMLPSLFNRYQLSLVASFASNPSASLISPFPEYLAGIPIPDDCCIHSQKQCNDISTTLVPPTPSPRLPDTTTPTVLEQTTILDNGQALLRTSLWPPGYWHALSHSQGNAQQNSSSSHPPAMAWATRWTLQWPTQLRSANSTASTSLAAWLLTSTTQWPQATTASITQTSSQLCSPMAPGHAAPTTGGSIVSGTLCKPLSDIPQFLTQFSPGEQKQCYVHPEADFQPLVGGGGVFNISAFLDAINIRPGGSFVAPLVDCSGACFTYTTLTIISQSPESLGCVSLCRITPLIKLSLTRWSRRLDQPLQDSERLWHINCSYQKELRGVHSQRRDGDAMQLLWWPVQCLRDDSSGR